MLKLSKKVEYGLISVLYIESQIDSGPITCRKICETYNLPNEMTGKVLQSLKKADIVESVQGVKGGYRLARPLSDISIGELIESIDGPMALTPCTNQCSCERQENCNIKTPVHHLQQILHDFSYSISLEQFQKVDLTPETIGAYDVYIEGR